MMVDSGSTATVCGLEHFSDTPVTIGPPMRLRASNGQPLKHYGQKEVELLSDSGEKMHVTFSAHDVKRAMNFYVREKHTHEKKTHTPEKKHT